MSSKLNLILSYNKSIRAIINSQVQRTGSDKSTEPVLLQIKKRLKISKQEDWGFICTALDTIGDTSYAIENFVKYKMDGPTKYNNHGEKFLRLYGFLNAVYIQQNSVCCIYNIFNVGSIEELKEKIEELTITQLLHKLASHNALYLSKEGTKDTFITGQLHPNSDEIFYGSNLNRYSETVNLIYILNEHIEIMLEALDSLYDKLINTLYKTGPERRKEFLEELRLLRIEKEGGMVIRVSPDFNVIVTMAT